MFKHIKFVLQEHQPTMNPSTEELARVILGRIGLEPRKRGATDRMHRVLLELYERAKAANRQKKPESSVMTVEEMAYFAGISRQTMYEYLSRWTELQFISKTSYINNSAVVIGYKLNGNTLEQAFERAMRRVGEHLDLTQKYIRELQRIIKNGKIAETQQMRQVNADAPAEAVEA